MVARAESAKSGNPIFTLERLTVGEDVNFTGTVTCPSCKDTTFVTFIRSAKNMSPTISSALECKKCGNSFRGDLNTGINQVTVSLIKS
ncbi:hypothetical protein HY029_05940 [Candidatus Gottesmanbacteria bacterium]|nr:hypothetical protein [Candidatus Gottesmanbacteria bacterium]